MAGVAAVIERLRDAILADDNLRIAQLLCGTLDGTPLDPGTLAHPSNCPVLHLAVSRSNLWAVSMLLLAGADVDVTGQWGVKAMMLAVLQSKLLFVQLFSAYGATRIYTHPNNSTAEGIGGIRPDVLQWLVSTRQWQPELLPWDAVQRLVPTPLHHFRVIGIGHTRTLLRSGADISAAAHAAVEGAPTPLSLAMQAQGNGAADLIVLAARPWTPATHHLFPAAARARACELLLIGHALARQHGTEQSLLDPWLDVLMPQVVTR